MAAAIGAVINSLVQHVLMPIVGILFGAPSVDDLILTINGSEILYGSFITAVVTFILIALALFSFIVKPYERFKAKKEAAPPPGPFAEEKLPTEIRDALTAR